MVPSRVTVLRHPNSRRTAGLLLSLAALALCVLASIAIGSRSTSLAEVFGAFSAFDGSDEHVIVRELRVPRTELGLLVGAALGAAGALMQGVTRNPLAEPGILGINAGAALAVVLAISLAGIASTTAYAVVALAGAALTALAIFALAGSRATPIALTLAGAVLATLLISLTSTVLVFDARTLDEFRFWIVGSIAGRDASVVAAVLPFIAAGLAIALVAGRRLNALALGDDVARSLGQRVERRASRRDWASSFSRAGRSPRPGPWRSSGLRCRTSPARSSGPTTAGSCLTASCSAPACC